MEYGVTSYFLLFIFYFLFLLCYAVVRLVLCCAMLYIYIYLLVLVRLFGAGVAQSWSVDGTYIGTTNKGFLVVYSHSHFPHGG